MSNDLLMDFSVDKANKLITVKREFNAELSLVWDAFTIPEILDKWWAPKPWQSKTKFMNFIEGGQRLYAMVSPSGEEHWGLTTYKSIQHQNLYKGFDNFCDKDGNLTIELPQSKWVTKFHPIENGKTLVKIKTTYNDLSQLESIIRMGFKEGLTKAMEELDVILTTEKTTNR
ncbi:MAG: SRPBCC domain-containing protein [Saprospiraceae bacterium]|nr:SRPBCC domain-containing protein [Saprospiraceae bacterium]